MYVAKSSTVVIVLPLGGNGSVVRLSVQGKVNVGDLLPLSGVDPRVRGGNEEVRLESFFHFI